jgi:hypothetical protein
MTVLMMKVGSLSCWLVCVTCVALVLSSAIDQVMIIQARDTTSPCFIQFVSSVRFYNIRRSNAAVASAIM